MEARRGWPGQTLTDFDSVEFLCDSEPDLGRLEETLRLYRVLVQGGDGLHFGRTTPEEVWPNDPELVAGQPIIARTITFKVRRVS